MDSTGTEDNFDAAVLKEVGSSGSLAELSTGSSASQPARRKPRCAPGEPAATPGIKESDKEGTEGAKEGATAGTAGGQDAASRLSKRERRRANRKAGVGVQPATVDAGRAAREAAAPSDSEAEALYALRAASGVLGDVAATAAAAQQHGAAASLGEPTNRLQELLRKRPVAAPAERSAGEAHRSATVEELVAEIRRACRVHDWHLLTDLTGRRQEYKEMSAVVRKLELRELAEFLKACTESHATADSRGRTSCRKWIRLLLEHAGDALMTIKQVRHTLRLLLTALGQRLDQGGRDATTEALACVGKWRLIGELAVMRRSSLQGAAATAVAAPGPRGAAEAAEGAEGSESGEEASVDDEGPEGDAD